MAVVAPFDDDEEALDGVVEPQSDGPTILQVTPNLNAGGVERGTIEIAEAIVVAGGRALVASQGGLLEPRLRRVGGELARLPMATKNPFNIAGNVLKLVDLIRSKSVDVVHARSRAPAWSAYWAARRCGVPFVTTYHGVYNEATAIKRRYNSVMAKGDVVIAVSQFVADLIKQRYGVPDERLVVIPRGANLKQFSEASTSMERVSALAADWGVFHDERPIVLFPARLTRWKGQAVFLEALSIIKAKRGAEALCGVIVGDGVGAFRDELESTIKKRGLEDLVRMVGHCDDMPSAFRLASVVATASLAPEAFGRVLVEAMAMGAPVIAPAHGGAMETVVDGVTGWLFEPGEAETLAMAIEHAIDLGQEGRQKISAAGVAHVRKNFSIKKMQASTIEVYQRVLGEVEAREGA